ncbi:MAG TPA: amidohydrolase family protein, partial [Alphaproteobacteria bacterium]|nr:amidohydrolase family protein [Alphaproteobacteria bacterium]
MPTIDSDAHVVETSRTWSFMRENEQDFRPQIFIRDMDDGAPVRPNQRNDYWVVDGRMLQKSNVGSDVPPEARDMTDVSRRLSHMDEVGIDVQVLYPTLFLRPITKEHDVEFALVRSYNRWLADIWSQSKDRLRWVAAPPLLSLVDPGKVRAELEFCKENGACGIFMRGMECERLLSHRYFFPLYEMAQDMGLAITLHAGVNSFAVHDVIPPDAGPLMLFKFPVIGAFSAILENELPKRFPSVNWAFIEASAQWVPYILGEVRLRLARKGKRASDDPLEGSNFFITTQKTDDLPWLLDEIGDDHLLIGTDYGHKDTATEVEALKRLAEDGDLP